MNKLFNENLGTAINSDELSKLKSRFKDYDPYYVAVSVMNTLPKFRKWLEAIWRQYEPYADTNFEKEFKVRFNQRAWELYLGATLLNRGCSLGKHRNVGPDFKILDQDRSIWIEAIAVGKGTGPDKVPGIEFTKKIVAVDVPEKEMILRLTAGLNEKYRKYLSYLRSGLVSGNDPFVIAVDRSDLEHLDPQIPLILKCLFAIGHQVLFIKNRNVAYKNKGSTWTTRAKVDKTRGSEIPTLLFRDSSFEGISAIIYCTDNILNCPREPERMGDNFVVVHNPFAKNPLLDVFFQFGEVWKQNNSQLIKIREISS